MSDSGLEWVWHRAEFRKARIECANATDDVELWEGLQLFLELHACSLLMLNFRHRLSLKQQKDLSDLATACDFDDSEIRAPQSGTMKSPVASSRMQSRTLEGPHRSLRASSNA